MGKPSKNQRVAGDKVVEKILPGKSVLYIGMGGKTFSCPSCDREFSKGMTYEHNGAMYCSRGCIAV